MTQEFADPANRSGGDILSGFILILGAVFSVLLILHHPVVHMNGGHTPGDFAAAVHPLAPLNRIVHGSLIFLIALQTIAFARFSQRLGFHRLSVTAGLTFFALGSVIMAIPATFDGFVLSDLAERCGAATTSCSAGLAPVLTFISVAIQAFSKIALVAFALGVASWSFALLTDRGMARLAGVIGLLAALAPAAVIVLGDLTLRPHSLAIIVGVLMLWYVSAGALLVGRKTWGA